MISVCTHTKLVVHVTAYETDAIKRLVDLSLTPRE